MFNMSSLFAGVYYNANITRGAGYKYGHCESGNPAVIEVPLAKLASPEGIDYLDRAVSAAPESDKSDVMRRVGEYVIEVFSAV